MSFGATSYTDPQSLSRAFVQMYLLQKKRWMKSNCYIIASFMAYVRQEEPKSIYLLRLQLSVECTAWKLNKFFLHLFWLFSNGLSQSIARDVYKTNTYMSKPSFRLKSTNCLKLTPVTQLSNRKREVTATKSIACWNPLFWLRFSLAETFSSLQQ